MRVCEKVKVSIQQSMNRPIFTTPHYTTLQHRPSTAHCTTLHHIHTHIHTHSPPHVRHSCPENLDRVEPARRRRDVRRGRWGRRGGGGCHCTCGGRRRGAFRSSRSALGRRQRGFRGWKSHIGAHLASATCRRRSRGDQLLLLLLLALLPLLLLVFAAPGVVPKRVVLPNTSDDPMRHCCGGVELVRTHCTHSHRLVVVHPPRLFCSRRFCVSSRPGLLGIP